MAKCYYTEDPQRVTEQPTLIASGSETDCRKAAAKALGRRSLRGLVQAPSARGVYYYESASEDAAYAEIVW